MKHLTVDEMIRFVSLTELNAEAKMLSAAVNGHIRRCGKCLKYVQAFQTIHDEFVQLNGSGDFKKHVCGKFEELKQLNVAGSEPDDAGEIDGY